MDRRELAVCAGLLATIGAVIGCGGHTLPSQDPSPVVASTALASAHVGEAPTPGESVDASAQSTANCIVADPIPQPEQATQGVASDIANTADQSPAVAKPDPVASKTHESQPTSQVVSETLPASVSPAAFPSGAAPSENISIGRERTAVRASSGDAREAELHFAITAGESTPTTGTAQPSGTITSSATVSESTTVSEAVERVMPVDSHTASHESPAEAERQNAPTQEPTFRLHVAGPEIPDSVTLRVADPNETAAQAKAAREKAAAKRDSTQRTASAGSAKRFVRHAAANPLEAAKAPIAKAPMIKAVGPKAEMNKPKGPTLAVRPKPSQVQPSQAQPSPAQSAKQDASEAEEVEPAGPTLAKRPVEPLVVGESTPRSDVSFSASTKPEAAVASAQPAGEPQADEPKSSEPVIAAVAPATAGPDKVANQNKNAVSPQAAPREQTVTKAAPPVQSEASSIASKPAQSADPAPTAEVAQQVVTPTPSTKAATEPANAVSVPSQVTASDVRKQDSAPVAVAQPPRSARRAMVGPSVREREIMERDTMGGRTPQMMAEVSKADAQVAHGFQLAERGALYLARSEFISALKLIAQANDVETGTRQFSRAVTAGLIALKESGDFVRHTSKVEDVDLSHIVAGHTTTVLKDKDVSEMAPSVAAQAYYDFARVQLAAAASQELVASMALYGLARATLVGAADNAQQAEFAGQATALYQTAIAVEPRNFRAANDLGVLLAKQGRLGEAAEFLTQSAAIAPSAAAWQNLATVYSRMGDKKLAEQLQAQSRALQRSGTGAVGPTVQWVDPATFASVAPATDSPLPPPVAQKSEQAPAKQPAPTPTNPPASVAKRLSEWLPMNIRR